MSTKTLTAYYGGKNNKVGKFIAEILPVHRHYIEPCGGMAAVLMQKAPSFTEVYNDIDNNLVTLFEVVRDLARLKELEEKLHYTPYSREEFLRCRRNMKTESDPVEKARMVYVMLSMGFLGSMGNKSFSFGGLKYEGSVARSFFNGLKNLPGINRRLRNVVIENQDAITICKRWDSNKSAIYLDPPYLKETRVSFNDYANEMSPEQHQELLDFATSCKSKVLISGYIHKMYVDALESNGFRRIDISTFSGGSTANGQGYDAVRTECIWFNYQTKDLANPLFDLEKRKESAA